MPAGRPAKYSSKILKMAENYIDHHEDFDDAVPTVAGLACVLGVVRDTCYDWAKDPEKREFSDALRRLSQKQERVLVNKGLKSEFNSPITKMMLTNHGYSDKVENDHTSSDGSLKPSTIILRPANDESDG